MAVGNNRGFSIAELLISLAVVGILLTALTSFVARSFTISREQFEQVRIVEDARIEMERMSDTLRNARYIDYAPAGVTDQPNERWLQNAQNYEVTVYTNIDGDPEAEKVRYFVTADSADLQRQITQLDANGATVGNPTTDIISRSVRNRTVVPAVPLFSYFTFGSVTQSMQYAPSTDTTSLPDCVMNQIARLHLRLVVDNNVQQAPTAVDIGTDVTPRTEGGSSTVCS